MFSEVYAKVCLKWKLHTNSVQLSCKVEDIDFGVRFMDPNHNYVADCQISFDGSVCSTNNKTFSISQNLTTKVTTLTIPIKEGITTSGRWSCFHGKKYESDFADVTTYRSWGKLSCMNVTSSKIIGRYYT